jgi:glutathione peroxidase-family protein
MLALVFALLSNQVVYGLQDQHENCEFWASSGECVANPNYMLVNCALSCSPQIGQTTSSKSLDFYSIVEKDIDGNDIKFDRFRGKVVYIVNVASQCGYTAENYDLLRSLTSLRSHLFEILIFPCNQFGRQEPGSGADIRKFAYGHGFQGIIMEKGDVNGPNARPTFKFLKEKTSKKQINW